MSNHHFSFKDFYQMCQHHVSMTHARECMLVMDQEDCLFYPGIWLPYERASKLYSLRFEIAQENILDDPSFLFDFELFLKRLGNSRAKDIGISALEVENYEFMSFYEINNVNILGILKRSGGKSLEAHEAFNTNAIQEGNTSSAEKYSKGLFVRDWK